MCMTLTRDMPQHTACTSQVKLLCPMALTTHALSGDAGRTLSPTPSLRRRLSTVAVTGMCAACRMALTHDMPRHTACTSQVKLLCHMALTTHALSGDAGQTLSPTPSLRRRLSTVAVTGMCAARRMALTHGMHWPSKVTVPHGPDHPRTLRRRCLHARDVPHDPDTRHATRYGMHSMSPPHLAHRVTSLTRNCPPPLGPP